MLLVQGSLLLLLSWPMVSVNSNPGSIGLIPLKQVENNSYAGNTAIDFGSSFSPRMDFEQWKPLTGRGNPLRNDPTYDYEPPVLERVHYWADDSRVESERYPERKSEVLVLGVSSRKPSVASRQPPTPPLRQHRPPLSKYEDFTYKYSEHYPMTILVPPPPPPPGHQPSLFNFPEAKLPDQIFLPKQTDKPIKFITRATTMVPDIVSSYAVQEANLIYQSSTTNQNWFLDYNQTKTLANNPVTSDYAGWGPTTPFDDKEIVNDSHNLVAIDHSVEILKPHSIYKPLLREPTVAPLVTIKHPVTTTFVPTALPPLETTIKSTVTTWTPNDITYEPITESQNIFEEPNTEHENTNTMPVASTLSSKPQPTIFDMLGPMMSMPLVTESDKPGDNLQAYASENIHVFKEHTTIDTNNLDLMQTMQPPPPDSSPDKITTIQTQSFKVNPHQLNHLLHSKPSVHTHDPYLHMRFTTPMPTISTNHLKEDHLQERPSTDVPNIPMYLIIQGHSKVKTYSSKPKNNDNSTLSNDIIKPRQTNEVKHLHPLKDINTNKMDKFDSSRVGRAQNLKTLVDNGLGSIEIQEADVGIQYDVSDGSEVPVEVYKKGIVDNDENKYLKSENNNKRIKRLFNIEDLIPFYGDSVEKYVHNILKGPKNETGDTDSIARFFKNDKIATIDKLENKNKEKNKHENEDR